MDTGFWQPLFPSSYTFFRARVNTPALPSFVQPGSQEWIFTLEVDLMIRTSVSEILSPPKKQCILLSVRQRVKEKVIRTPVKMRATTLFMIFLINVSWARDTGLNSKYNASKGGWIAKELGQSAIGLKITKWRHKGGQTTANLA